MKTNVLILILCLSVISIFSSKISALQSEDRYNTEISDLPEVISDFIDDFLPNDEIYSIVVYEKNKFYEVNLKSETFLKFDDKYRWCIIENNKGVSKNIHRVIPTKIITYLNDNISNQAITKITRDVFGYVISLNDKDYSFDEYGNLK